MHHRYSRATRALWTACMYVRVRNACMCIRPVWCNRTNRVFVLVSSDTWTNDCRTHIQFLRRLNECNRSWNSNSSAKEAENKIAFNWNLSALYQFILAQMESRNDISKIDAFMEIDCSDFPFFSFYFKSRCFAQMEYRDSLIFRPRINSTKLKNTRNAQCRLKNNRNCET